MQFIFATTLEDVLEAAFEDGFPGPRSMPELTSKL